jgi:hypothetical protein
VAQQDIIGAMLDRFWRSSATCPGCGAAATCVREFRGQPKDVFVNNDLDFGSRVPDKRYKRTLILAMDPDRVTIGAADYRLIAFMDHTGTWARWGHDAAYVRDGKQWVLFNDASVLEILDLAASVTFGAVLVPFSED